VNALNLQQFDYISVESTGDGGASPLPGGRAYDLYFVPPANNDWLVFSYDMLNFNPEDEEVGGVLLTSLTVERIPLSALSTGTVVASYSFDTSTEGWTEEGAPAALTLPGYAHIGGALELSSVAGANTFGYWQSNAGDITVAGDVLYRGTFEVRTEVADASAVAQLRLRFNTENLQVSRTLGYESIGDGANSPGVVTRIYDNLYFVAPANCVGGGMYICFDLLNFFWPYDYGNLILDSVMVESLAIPTF
jgi:hypothetical protein